MVRTFFFRPLLLPTLITLPLLFLLMGLGLWQSERAEEKSVTQALLKVRGEGIRPLFSLKNEQDIVFFKVQVEGRFLHQWERHLFKPYKGIMGYHIITPLRLDNGEVVLIDRGFVQEKDRQAQRADKGKVTLKGVITRSYEKRWFHPDKDQKENIWYVANIHLLSKGMPFKVKPFFIAAQGEDKEFFTPPPFYKAGRNHQAYAWTWYSLWLGLVVIYLVYHRSKGRLGVRR